MAAKRNNSNPFSSARASEIFTDYQNSFSAKIYGKENDEYDLLMDLYGITPQLKRENRQYWGRELGMCWQRLVAALCEDTRNDYKPALRVGMDEPCDLIVGKVAIDTKYRIGSGDSGTLKKFKTYGKLLVEKGYTPVMLILREDNLNAALTACRGGGWTIKTGQDTFGYLRELTGFDLEGFLRKRTLAFPIAPQRTGLLAGDSVYKRRQSCCSC